MKRRGFLEAALVCTYLALVIPFGEHYPLSPLEMFSFDQAVVGRIGAIEGASGNNERLETVTHFDDWHCPMGYTIDHAHFRDCFPEGFSSLADFDSRALREHASPAPVGTPVRLVRRLYSLDHPDSPFVTRDCVIQICTARRASR